ncbi:unnamed protein product [Plutella xylostella]|uniref:(diamondback moth) hypothetical protein n=1 Tax=Plutella xylostella TaxID=51655 RepID=A0A8S4G2A9_PLUXY|nr:unnamed protein product [Plutella xylostella]
MSDRCGDMRVRTGSVTAQLLQMLKFYARFEISDETGDPMTDRDMTLLHYSRITSLQKAAFAKFPDLRKFSLANVASVDTRETLQKHFGNLSDKALRAIATHLNLVPPEGREEEFPWHRLDKEFLTELLISRHERRISQLEELNSMPLYPTEAVIWDENVVPTEIYGGDSCLALPKLNLQFLTLHDYLLRNFNLFRLESTYEIRQDIEDAVYRLAPWRAEDGGVYFGGWARMAHPIQSFAVVEVAKPLIGERAPSRVRADVTVTLSVRHEIKHEWENLRKHDVCFLITVRPTQPIGTKYDYRRSMVEQAGIVYVRGCEVEGMLDAAGRVLEEGPEPRPALPADTRTFRLLLDANQYAADLDTASTGGEVEEYLCSDRVKCTKESSPKERYIQLRKQPNSFHRRSMVEQGGIVYVRGCEVEGMLDAAGRVLEEGPEPRPALPADTRTFRLLLDANQYAADLDTASTGREVGYWSYSSRRLNKL